MPDDNDEKHVLYIPDSPNNLDAVSDADDEKRSAKERSRAEDLAEKVAIGDELSGYEKVAGRGVADE